MNTKIRRQLKNRKRRIEKRLDKTKLPPECPVIAAANIHYEISEKMGAISAGGIGMIHQMVHRLELDQMINRHLNIFKIYHAEPKKVHHQCNTTKRSKSPTKPVATLRVRRNNLRQNQRNN